MGEICRTQHGNQRVRGCNSQIKDSTRGLMASSAFNAIDLILRCSKPERALSAPDGFRILESVESDILPH
jgi:hypothetical protein